MQEVDPAACRVTQWRETQGLGLEIVRTLVMDQLRGELEISSAGETPWPRPLTAELDSDSRVATTRVKVVCPLAL